MKDGGQDQIPLIKLETGTPQVSGKWVSPQMGDLDLHDKQSGTEDMHMGITILVSSRVKASGEVVLILDNLPGIP